MRSASRACGLVVFSLALGVPFAAAQPAHEATVFIRVIGDITAARSLDERAWRESVELREVEFATGSGVLISPQGYVLTNVHVIEGRRIQAIYQGAPIDITLRVNRIDVMLPGRRGSAASFERLPASVIATDPELDLAVLFVGGTDLPHAPLGDSDALEIGRPVTAVGYPFGRKLDLAAPSTDAPPAPTVTGGLLSAVRRDAQDGARYLQTSAAVASGNSGGPLVDADGYVIGIVQLKVEEAANIGFAIPINLAKRLLIAHGLDRMIPVPLLSLMGAYDAVDKGVRFLAPAGFEDMSRSRTQVWSGSSLSQLTLRVDRVAAKATAPQLEQALLAGRLIKGVTAARVWSRQEGRPGAPALLVGKATATRSDGPTRMLYAMLDLRDEPVVAVYEGHPDVIAANESVLLESLRSLTAAPLRATQP